MAAMQMLTTEQAAAKLAVSKRTFYKLAQQPGFPSPLRIGPRLVRYSDVALDQWLQERMMRA